MLDLSLLALDPPDHTRLRRLPRRRSLRSGWPAMTHTPVEAAIARRARKADTAMTLHRALTGVHSRYINKIAERLAGRRGSLADLEHVGRTSGVVRHTPLRVFRTGDTVVIGLNFGRESDWLKNIAAAGGCRMRSLRDTNLQLAPGVAGYSDNELDAVVTDGLRRQLAAGVTHDA